MFFFKQESKRKIKETKKFYGVDHEGVLATPSRKYTPEELCIASFWHGEPSPVSVTPVKLDASPSLPKNVRV